MIQKLTRGLVTGLLGLCLIFAGCSSDSDRILSPGDNVADQAFEIYQYEDNTTLDDWFDFTYDDEAEADDATPGGGAGDSGQGGNLNENDNEEEVILE